MFLCKFRQWNTRAASTAAKARRMIYAPKSELSSLKFRTAEGEAFAKSVLV